ncbi:hypothetical protein BGZ96_002879 [Linnemannia gamsii]|uniref:C2H2-type domain-containing protein n=1 Tax=Linnemannia gamsii TaxID=64522 RepID=A0ABQ7JJZ4_9FUNG|nr:hypothetical protein BGZ96_002879 [Linnemannia gamsii]
MSRNTASKPTVAPPVEENTSFLPDSVEDFTKKSPFNLPEPVYIVPSQVLQDPISCLIGRWKRLGDFIAILEYSFTCTSQRPSNWIPKSHMVELGTYFEIPELNHLGRKKRIAIVFQRYFVELSNSSLPYLPFCEKLDLLTRDDAAILATLPPLIPTSATTTTTTTSKTFGPHSPPTPSQVLLATPIPTDVNAFPKGVRWIIVAKAVFNDIAGQFHKQISGLCVLEFELVTPPAVESPTASPSSSPPNSSPSSSSSSQSPPSPEGLKWKTTDNTYILNVFSVDQEYSTSPLRCAEGHHANNSELQYGLTLKLGIDKTNPQSYFAFRSPRNDYKDDPSTFSMNSVEQSSECSIHSLKVTTHSLPRSNKLIFQNVEYLPAQKSLRKKSLRKMSLRKKSAPLSSSSMLRSILPAPTPPISITPDISHSKINSCTSPSGSGLLSSSSASASASRSPSPPSLGCNPPSMSGVSPVASSTTMPTIHCPRSNCESVFGSTKALKAHLENIHDNPTVYSCEKRELSE